MRVTEKEFQEEVSAGAAALARLSDGLAADGMLGAAEVASRGRLTIAALWKQREDRDTEIAALKARIAALESR